MGPYRCIQGHMDSQILFIIKIKNQDSRDKGFPSFIHCLKLTMSQEGPSSIESRKSTWCSDTQAASCSVHCFWRCLYFPLAMPKLTRVVSMRCNCLHLQKLAYPFTRGLVCHLKQEVVFLYMHSLVISVTSCSSVRS